MSRDKAICTKFSLHLIKDGEIGGGTICRKGINARYKRMLASYTEINSVINISKIL
jgi:hypothetical protein